MAQGLMLYGINHYLKIYKNKNTMRYLQNIEYKKLLIAFFTHLFISVLYGSILGLMIKEQFGIEYAWLSSSVLLGAIGLTTYISYKEETQRYYPFLKALGVNFFAAVLFVLVSFMKIDLLYIVAYLLSLWAIRYKCNSCVAYRRFKID